MIDTHCHIHDDDYQLDVNVVLEEANKCGVSKVVCVGTDTTSSANATKIAAKHKEVFATVGLHPNDKNTPQDIKKIEQLVSNDKVVAVGECGLDYYYEFNSRNLQKQLLKLQLVVAKKYSLPMVFHLRGSKDDPEDAFDDFWEIYDGFEVAGAVHSFSSSKKILDQIIERKLSVGVNGIATFMKDEQQISAIKAIPLNSLLLETDSPLLTPVPFRGTINEPKHIRVILSFLSRLRGESEKQLQAATTKNAENLFKI